jgi:hypothetical protein
VIATSTPNGAMVIGSFRCGGNDLVIERTGRPGRARLCRSTAGDLVPVADLSFDSATGALTEHWRRSEATASLRNQTIAAWVACALPVLADWSKRTSSPAHRTRQREAIEDLVQFRLPVADAAQALEAVEPAAELRYFLTRIELCSALHRHLSGELSAGDLRAWAAAYYGRPDAGGELDHFEAIGKVLRAIAEPGTDPHLSLERPHTLLRALDLAWTPWYRCPTAQGLAGALACAGAPMLFGGQPLPFPAVAGVGLAAAHAIRYGFDRVRFGRDTALAAARRDALASLPACIAAMWSATW